MHFFIICPSTSVNTWTLMDSAVCKFIFPLKNLKETTKNLLLIKQRGLTAVLRYLLSSKGLSADKKKILRWGLWSEIALKSKTIVGGGGLLGFHALQTW